MLDPPLFNAIAFLLSNGNGAEFLQYICGGVWPSISERKESGHCSIYDVIRLSQLNEGLNTQVMHTYTSRVSCC